MSKVDLGAEKVYMIGIGGSSMSGLALLLKKEGFEVSGSDSQLSVKVEHLMENGINVYIGQREENIIKDQPDVIVYTAAISADNPELRYAREHGIRLMKRSQLVGAVMSCYKNAVGISGTKGKTTTVSLLSTVFIECGLDPSALIGGTAKNIGSNYRVGSDEYIVAESCEYQDSFLDFKPTVSVILNIELEHTDYFKSIEQLKRSFEGFAKLVPDDGAVIGCSDCPETMKIWNRIDRPKFTFGINNPADYEARNIIEDGCGTLSLDIYENGVFSAKAEVPICGKHNAYNILAVYAVARFYGLDGDTITEAMKAYKGAGRRFDLYGEVNGAKVFDDYAHTPDEYRAVISAAKGLKHNRIMGIFQPHTFSRSLDFFDETVDAFEECDEVIMLDIYAAREIDDGRIHSRDFEAAMKKKGYNVKYMPAYEEVADYIAKKALPDDIILVIGAGHSNRLCEMIAAKGTPTKLQHGD